MKKFFAILLASMLTVGMCGISAFADNQTYNVPAAVTAPTIDGTIDAAEWENALSVPVDYDNMTWVLDAADSTIGAGSTIQVMYDANAIYFAANILDSTVSAKNPDAGGALNAGDGIQLCIYSATDAANGDGATNLFWDFLPWTGDSHDAATAESFEHFSYNATTDACSIASVIVGTGYTLEFSIPWAAFSANGYSAAYTGTVGTEIIMNLIVLDVDDGGAQSLGFTSDGWCVPDATDIFVLSADAAGFIPVEEEAPAIEEAPAVEEAAPVVTTTAAQTSDAVIGLSALAIAAAGAALVISKKNNK